MQIILLCFFFFYQHNKAQFINYISAFSTVQPGVASGMSMFELAYLLVLFGVQAARRHRHLLCFYLFLHLLPFLHGLWQLLEPCRKKPLAHWLDTHARKLIFHGDIIYTWREWGSTTPFIWMADAMLATSAQEVPNWPLTSLQKMQIEAHTHTYNLCVCVSLFASSVCFWQAAWPHHRCLQFCFHQHE